MEPNTAEQPPQMHAYLGELEDVEHPVHSYFAEGAVVKLPLIYLPDIVLFPGDDLPLRMLSEANIESIRNQLSSEGAVLAVLSPHQGDVAFGTTVRIERFSVTHGCASVTGAAKQRFRLKNARRYGRESVAAVEILPHPRPPRVPFPAFPLQQLRTLDASESSQQQTLPPQKRRRHQAMRVYEQRFTGYWGSHAYALYDTKQLVQRIVDLFISSTHWTWFRNGSSTNTNDSATMLHYLTQPSEHEHDPSIFAYWVAGNLPLDRDNRLTLLKIDCIVRLLRVEIEILEQFGDNIYCSGCGAFLAHTRDIFSMTTYGAGGTFVNPGGNVFQILTLRDIHLERVLIDVVRSTQDSWFPGYSWSIVYCNSCYRHLGWQFDVVDSACTHPARFYGFRRNALTQSYNEEQHQLQHAEGYFSHSDDEDEDDDM
uniref:Protein cereblon n=1 Tax=Globisporangium ultimum (strain ATCC 200006 / CBS 805.95 / DAOM BR144) TaxID=431595 RepID=K3W519_GLOUD